MAPKGGKARLARIFWLIGLAALVAPLAAAADEAPLTGPDRWMPLLGSPQRPSALIIEDAYRQVLGAWAGGLAAQAAAARADLERRFSTGPPGECLQRVRRNTLEELVAQDPSLFLALLDLEVAGWRELVAARDLSHSTTLREAAEEWAETFLRLEGAEPGAAADLLHGWALELFQTGFLHLMERAPRLLDLALEGRPDHLAALHLSASIHEKLGDYTTAAERLAHILELDPLDPHALLHQAINGTRVGDADAPAALRGIAGGGGPPWRRQVAYETLARLALESGDVAGAIEIAHLGVEDLAGAERLEILLAYLEVRQAHLPSPRTEPLLGRARPMAETPPRIRYDLGHAPLRAAALERLRQAQARRRRPLGEALRSLVRDDDARHRTAGCRGLAKRLHVDFDHVLGRRTR